MEIRLEVIGKNSTKKNDLSPQFHHVLMVKFDGKPLILAKHLQPVFVYSITGNHILGIRVIEILTLTLCFPEGKLKKKGRKNITSLP